MSRSDADYGLHITGGDSNYACFSGLRRKSDVLGAIEVWHASMTTAGVRPLVLTIDMGGGFAGQDADETYARPGLASRLRAPGARVNGVGSTHRHLYRSVRPAMLVGNVPPSLWEEACVWAIDAHNCRAVAGLAPHVQLSGSWPDLTPLAPFYSFVVALNNSSTSGRFNSLSLLPRYTGPIRQHGIGAIRVEIDRTVRVVRTCGCVVRGRSFDVRGARSAPRFQHPPPPAALPGGQPALTTAFRPVSNLLLSGTKNTGQTRRRD